MKRKIETIEVGKTITKEYEVRVNKDITDGKITTNKCTTKYNDVTTESDDLSSTLKSGDIRVTVKRITDRRNELQNGGEVEYIAIIENISEQQKNNVKINTNVQNKLKVNLLKLSTGDFDPNVEISDNEYKRYRR